MKLFSRMYEFYYFILIIHNKQILLMLQVVTYDFHVKSIMGTKKEIL